MNETSDPQILAGNYHLQIGSEDHDIDPLPPDLRRQHVVEQLETAQAVVTVLITRGFQVRAILVGNARPVIRLHGCPLCTDLRKKGVAAWYRATYESGARYFTFVWHLYGCRIEWIERNPALL